jgi:hypothetical protein
LLLELMLLIFVGIYEDEHMMSFVLQFLYKMLQVDDCLPVWIYDEGSEFFICVLNCVFLHVSRFWPGFVLFSNAVSCDHSHVGILFQCISQICTSAAPCTILPIFTTILAHGPTAADSFPPGLYELSNLGLLVLNSTLAPPKVLRGIFRSLEVFPPVPFHVCLVQ